MELYYTKWAQQFSAILVNNNFSVIVLVKPSLAYTLDPLTIWLIYFEAYTALVFIFS